MRDSDPPSRGGDDGRNFSDIDELKELGGFEELDEDAADDESSDDSEPDKADKYIEQVTTAVALSAEDAASLRAINDANDDIPADPDDEYYAHIVPIKLRKLADQDIEVIGESAANCIVLMNSRDLGDFELTERMFEYEELLTQVASETDIRVEELCRKADVMAPQEMRVKMLQKEENKMGSK
ncbi:hypothetical protein ACFL2V_15340 [Pseudomonadota bacterium]